MALHSYQLLTAVCLGSVQTVSYFFLVILPVKEELQKNCFPQHFIMFKHSPNCFYFKKKLIFFPPSLLPLSQVSEEGVSFCGLLVWGGIFSVVSIFKTKAPTQTFCPFIFNWGFLDKIMKFIQ